MTDAQWKAYRKENEGKWIKDWIGSIREVSGSGPYLVFIDIPGGCSLSFRTTSGQQALSYSTGQVVMIDGQIEGFYSFLGLTDITMQDDTVVVRPLR